MFEMYDEEFLDADDVKGIEESKQVDNNFDEIEEEPTLVTIKTLTPSSE